ncbi:MAG: acetolactate decarboxylase, partial [Phycisphaerae bacterium]|nr:acetolactate decarboxylase [Phycisphaerae bacterium]
GYHFHFITDDRTQGGHVLLCRPGDVLLKVDKIARIHVDLPQSGDFLKADLNEEKADELHKVEK